MRIQVVALVLLCVATQGQCATYEPSIGVTFPDTVAGLPIGKRVEFPQKALGVNIGYQRSGSATRGSVYIYNSGLFSIPSGVDSPIVRTHFTQVIAEVMQLPKSGQARAVNLIGDGEQTTTYQGCGPQFIWRAYALDLGDLKLTSYTYLTAMKNNFVKLRVSHFQNDEQGKRETDQFVQEIRKVLGTCS
jgi:hypothetical protein